MQDPKSGVKGSEQKLKVTVIPHVFAGETGIQTHPHTYLNEHTFIYNLGGELVCMA